jgi:hypothetical protein
MSSKLIAFCNRATQYLISTKIVHQTIKIYQKNHLFVLYFYNIHILLTNKIIIKRNQTIFFFFFKKKKTMGE